MSSSRCRRGTADGIVRFYREILETAADAGEDAQGPFARAAVGAGQHLVFRETDKPAPAFDGHHVADLPRRFLRPLSAPAREGPRHRGERPAPVPLRGHRRPRQRQGAVHDRARGAQHAPSDVRPAARQPQSRADQPQVCAGARGDELVAAARRLIGGAEPVAATFGTRTSRGSRRPARWRPAARAGAAWPCRLRSRPPTGAR